MQKQAKEKERDALRYRSLSSLYIKIITVFGSIQALKS
jgi:hypothetical protein